MSKLIIHDPNGELVQERELLTERVSIGRKAGNDIVLDHPAVSGEHALVTTIRNDSFVEDLNSTNGTRVNGRIVKKYLLQDGDDIKVGKFRLHYVYEPLAQAGIRVSQEPPATLSRGDTLPPSGFVPRDLADTALAQAETAATLRMAAGLAPDTRSRFPRGSLQILTGPTAGRELDLTRSTTTLGKPGIQVAVIARREDGFYFMFEEGGSYPLVNGSPVGACAVRLNNYDVIELAGVMMEFSLKS